MKRQAATICGLQRRVRDLKLTKITDPRDQRLIKNPLETIVVSTLTAMLTGAAGLRGVETRTEQIATKHPGWQGICKRIADNTIGALLRRLDPEEIGACQHSLAKAEARRGNLQPTHIAVATVSIDGKNLTTLPWHELCRLAELEKHTAKPAEVRELLKEKCPQVQVCIPKDSAPYGLVRCHTVTLVSSDAAYCVHLRNIPGETSEIGALPETLRQLHQAYFRTDLIELVTTDAGNTSKKTAKQTVDECGWDYFAQIKKIHGQLYTTTAMSLGVKQESEANYSYSETRDGFIVTYHIWRHELNKFGWFGWPHARQLIRVKRQVVDPKTGATITGNRYYVCSRTGESISAEDCLKVSRLHWRCENETHWTADAVFNEDARRQKWARHPAGILVAAILRQIAIAILAMARSLSRTSTHSGKPTWRQVIEHFILQLCGSTLQTEAFDTYPA